MSRKFKDPFSKVRDDILSVLIGLFDQQKIMHWFKNYFKKYVQIRCLEFHKVALSDFWSGKFLMTVFWPFFLWPFVFISFKTCKFAVYPFNETVSRFVSMSFRIILINSVQSMFRIREQTSQIIPVAWEKKQNKKPSLILSLTYPHSHTYTRVSARSPVQAICAID